MSYRDDPWGRPIHRELDVLAGEIIRAIDENGGSLKVYEIPLDRYQRLETYAAKFNGGAPMCKLADRINFIWCGVQVSPISELGAFYDRMAKI